MWFTKKTGRPKIRENMYRRGYNIGHRQGVKEGQKSTKLFYEGFIEKNYQLKEGNQK